MKNEAERLRQELEQVPQASSRRAPAGSPEYPAELVARVLEYVTEQRRAGKTLRECARELGMPKERLHYWVYQRSRQPLQKAAPPALRAVQLDAAPPAQEPARPRRFVLHSRFGWELRDLELWEVVALMRGLS